MSKDEDLMLLAKTGQKLTFLVAASTLFKSLTETEKLSICESLLAQCKQAPGRKLEIISSREPG